MCNAGGVLFLGKVRGASHSSISCAWWWALGDITIAQALVTAQSFRLRFPNSRVGGGTRGCADAQASVPDTDWYKQTHWTSTSSHHNMGMGASVVDPTGISSTNRVSLEVCLSFTQGVLSLAGVEPLF